MIQKEDILRLTGNGLFIFRHYISGDWRLGKHFRNPLYNDTNPGCIINLSKDRTTYLMCDHGNTYYSGDCFDIVGKILGYADRNSNFNAILKTINKDMLLGLEDISSENTHHTKSKAKVQSLKPAYKEVEEVDLPKITVDKTYKFTDKEFTRAELEFWARSGITQDVLNKYNVVSILEYRYVTKAGKNSWNTSKINEPIFGYVRKEFIKIYRPFSAKRFSYCGVMPEYYCFGLDQLSAKGDILFITGGEKDVMSLFVKGFNAICFNSETVSIPKSLISILTYRFKHIVILYDMDKTGVEHSAKQRQNLSEYGAMQMLLPLGGSKEEKDISDFFRLGNSAGDLRKLFAELLRTRYSNTVSILNSCRVSLELPPPESEVIVSINDVPLGTNGNLLCVTGGEGTGKS
ncbi:MAG: toprim domain-containing protein, partial [Rikenellaceae bacterium]